jgi:hypothetical protein
MWARLVCARTMFSCISMAEDPLPLSLHAYINIVAEPILFNIVMEVICSFLFLIIIENDFRYICSCKILKKSKTIFCCVRKFMYFCKPNNNSDKSNYMVSGTL